MDFITTSQTCAICNSPLMLHQQLLSTLPPTVLAAMSTKQHLERSQSTHEKPLKIRNTTSASDSNSLIYSSNFSTTPISHSSSHSVLLYSQPNISPDTILAPPILRSSSALQLRSKDNKETKNFRPTLLNDEKTEQDFLQWQNTWRNLLDFPAPWCTSCWKRFYEETRELYYLAGEEVVSERFYFNQLSELTEEVINDLINREIQTVDFLKGELVGLKEENVELVNKAQALEIRLLANVEMSGDVVKERCVLAREMMVYDEQINSKCSVWDELFEVEWYEDDVVINQTSIRKSMIENESISIMGIFGSIMRQITLTSKVGGCIIQKCNINGYGYGSLKVTHKDFKSVKRSKFKKALQILLIALDEVSSFLEETRNFVLPYAVTGKEFIDTISFLNIGNMDNWLLAFKFFLLDVIFLSKCVIKGNGTYLGSSMNYV
ncbi:Atg6 BARA domain-containing protein [Entamoeba marina]